MLVSEMISALQELMVQHGDRDVAFRVAGDLIMANDASLPRMEFSICYENNADIIDKFDLDDHRWDAVSTEQRQLMIESGVIPIVVVSVIIEKAFW